MMTAFAGCVPLGLRIPWGIAKLPWAIAYQDVNARLSLTTADGKRVLFDQPLAEKGAAASPSGAHVAVVTAKGELWIVPLIIGDPVKLTSAPVASDFWPQVSPWSRNGRALTYISNGNVFYQRLARPARQLSSTGDAFTAALSPDGRFVAYGRKDKREKDLGLWVVDTRGREQPRQLVEPTGDVFSACCPSWSPDGHWVAFLQAYEGGALGVAKADGTDTRVGLEAAWEPLSWLPDSSALLFVRVPYGDLPDGLWRYSISESKAKRLAEPGKDVQYALSPDATRALLAVSTPSPHEPPAQSRLSLISLPAGTAWPEKGTVSGQVLQTYWSPKGDIALLSLIKEHSEIFTSSGDLAKLRSLGEARNVAGWVHYR